MLNHPRHNHALYWALAFNAMPLLGVLFLNWHIFELVFLYWLENVVIGVITFLKFIVRRYEHPVELFLPLFFAPFFLVHYGGFTAGHGLFVFALFGEDWAAANGLPARDLARQLLFDQGLAFALIGLVFLHIREWQRDVAKRGLGADTVFGLMMAPYRRIIVLHLTILGSGFAFRELGEPLVALLFLVGLKTAFDVYHHRDGTNSKVMSNDKTRMIQDAMMEKKFEINGREYTFDTYTEMAESKHFATAMNVLRIIISREEFKVAEDFLAEKIAKEMDLAERVQASA
ncbi:MAG: DUF6498-containing protein [Gammaproteobacteria bacterium]|nr:DUF6498-containing protein [Gammaproteobacteria bacterium]